MPDEKDKTPLHNNGANDKKFNTPDLQSQEINNILSDLDNCKEDVEKEIKRKLILLIQPYFDAIGRSIYNACIDLIEELPDVRSIKEFHCSPNGIDYNLDEFLEKIIKSQAHLIWHNKGRPFQNKYGMENDWFEAKRYIYYLLVDQMLQSCHTGDQCPLESFNKYSTTFLQSLTIEEYAKFKAYLKWIDRTKGDIYLESQHIDDYLCSINYIKKIIRGCDKCINHNNNAHWNEFITSNKFRDIQKIQTAKSNSLLIKNRQHKIQNVSTYVHNYYPVVYENHGKGFTASIIEHLRNHVGSAEHDIATMFEIVLNCHIHSQVMQ
jgi:hypothetical protein